MGKSDPDRYHIGKRHRDPKYMKVAKKNIRSNKKPWWSCGVLVIVGVGAVALAMALMAKVAVTLLAQ